MEARHARGGAHKEGGAPTGWANLFLIVCNSKPLCRSIEVLIFAACGRRKSLKSYIAVDYTQFFDGKQSIKIYATSQVKKKKSNYRSCSILFGSHFCPVLI